MNIREISNIITTVATGVAEVAQSAAGTPVDSTSVDTYHKAPTTNLSALVEGKSGGEASPAATSQSEKLSESIKVLGKFLKESDGKAWSVASANFIGNSPDLLRARETLAARGVILVGSLGEMSVLKDPKKMINKDTGERADYTWQERDKFYEEAFGLKS